MSDSGRAEAGGGEGGLAPAGTAELFVFTRQAAREADRLAAEQYGMPTLLLMENAAFHLAGVAVHLTKDAVPARVMIFCGPGNNGGDGLALARHLHNAGCAVEIMLAAPADGYAGDAAVNLGIAQRMGIPMVRLAEEQPAEVGRTVDRFGPPDLVVDALLGTGLSSPVREPLAGLIGWINELGRKGATVLAVDIPSGLDCDTGEPLGVAVQAGVTVSFLGLKKGFGSLTAQGYIGEVIVAGIGVPRELVEKLGTRLGGHEQPDRPEDARHEPHRAPPPRRGRPEDE
ncbi:MAG: NAD(P)H-hydrate epimerase [Phycisphaerales bacterium]